MSRRVLYFVIALFQVLMIEADHECGSVSGTCMTTDYPCDGQWADDLCLGPAERKCCVHPKHIKDDPLDPDCEIQDGICQDESNACHGKYVANLCHGPSIRKCCVEDPFNPFHHKTRSPKTGHGLRLVDAEHLNEDKRWRDMCGRGPEYLAKGNLAHMHTWPWQAQLLPTDNSDGFCSASLIAPNWLLTAASCFKRFRESKTWKVILGKSELVEAREDSENEYEISKVYLHNQHGVGQANYHDLALIKMKTKSVLDSSNKINAVCMPTSDMSFQDDECYALGWGKQGPSSNGKLYQIKVDVLSHDMCYRRVWGVSRGQICATNQKDLNCRVDLGSPLLCKKDGIFYLAGVATANVCNKDSRHAPAVFTRVPFYLDWVYMNTRKEKIG